MMNTDENTPIKGTGKNGKGEPPAKKAAKRSRKPVQQEPAQQAAPEPVQPEQIEQPQEPVQPEQIEQPQEPITVAAEAMENPPADVVPDVPAPSAIDATASEALAPAVTAEPTQSVPVSLQTIANAYGEFTRKSIEQTSSFFEQLAGVRSLNKAFELQGEFARQACETFIAESRKIRELHSELAMQRLRHLEGFMARMKPTRSV